MVTRLDPAAPTTPSSMCWSKQRRALYVVFALLLLALIICALGIWLTLIYLNSRAAELQRESDKFYIRSLVDAVNNDPKNTWKARLNPFGIRKVEVMMPEYLRNETEMRAIADDLMNMFSSKAMKSHIQKLVDYKEPLPAQFDAREKWPLCRSIRNVPNQGGCGSCYAVAATGVASDRACIASNGTIEAFFSEQDVISCCATCGGCLGGGLSIMVLHYWTTKGFVTGGRDGCIPYSADIQCGTPCSPEEFKLENMCKRECQSIYIRNSYENDRHFATSYLVINAAEDQYVEIPSIVDHLNISNDNLADVHEIIKKELLLFGPVTITFDAPEEFMHYSEGVYHPYPRDTFIDRIFYRHVARVIGWGTENGILHWLVINSFGQYWGENGLVRIEAAAMDEWGVLFDTGIV